ncbi:phosphodiester glycosidase family protein [Actinosynnema sp. NPDC047251]|uniref:Metallophosphoesterase n=1 Tax=Saccharothrix espanaensis (strain ATCC 51144 / DSM 44229 / JCM 9112 / NBRC 15066 / NRRL 15764) TaxID=1179773 RepID=K0KBM5_SACES|nr:phosphodiester glycosidase family protein [Saccharothrix espanaensis]CCH34033.1 Metallophosphoesterase [Saccharothrix espanaensis DSM 44229]
MPRRTWPLAATLVLALIPTSPGHAEPAAPTGVADLPDVVAARSAVDPARRIETTRTSRPVAPGVSLSSFDWYEPGDAGGWVRGDALTVDLTAGTRVDYLHPGQVTTAEPLSAQANRTRAVAAVNGDFFDINNSNAPEGVGVRDGAVVKSPAAGHRRAVGIDASGIGRVMDVLFDGRVTLADGGTIPLAQLNSASIAAGAFTPVWGSYSRARAVRGATKVAEVVVRDDVVTEVRTAAGDDPIPSDGYVLVGREAGADRLAALATGQRVTLDYTAKAGDGSALKAAIGGNQLLLKDGAVVAPDDPLHPRTAVGFSADGKKMFLLTVDGRQAPFLLGLNLKDMAAALKEMGAHNALNLDGGGSSTLLARTPGTEAVAVENTPSDGGERPVPNGLALYAPQGSGRLAGFWTRTAIDPRRAPGSDTVAGGHPERVFPGLTRRLVADGYDETYGPARDQAHLWQSTRPHVGWVADGVFRGLSKGTTKAVARRGGTTGEVELTVLGPLARLSATTNRLSLPEIGGTGGLGVVGHDPEGFTAPVEPADLDLDYDRAVVDIAPGDNGSLRVKALKPGATTVTARVGGTVVRVPVTVGLQEKVVANFDDGAAWTFGSARGSGSVAPVAEGRTGAGLKLAYDFGQSTGTRTAYAIPPRPIVLEGQPLALGAWVYGHGRGEWTAFTVTDNAGLTRSLYGPYITWTGWKYLEVPVPSGMAFPLSVTRFYTIETKADRQYSGEVLVDDIVAKVPPAVQLPAAQEVADRVVVQDGTVGNREWRFAVMSDAQFVARDPDSDLVRAARRTLREIKAQKPDFVVVNGDFVDEAAPADLAMAHRILNEELGDELPWYYVPGNHEIMGPGTIENFRREFGATNRVFDHKGTRFVLLDTSTGTVRGGGFDQAAMLRDALRDHGPVNSVVVVEHHPPRDPTPTKGSQLNDRLEADVVEDWLADFRRTTGKGAMFIGSHVGVFHASRVDGVPYLINGNSGKAPAEGGFSGWTMLGVDSRPKPGQEWIAAEIRPHVDGLSLAVPDTVRVGTPGAVAASVAQGSRQVPVKYPVSADWTGSLNVHIGQFAGLRPWHVAWLDPATGRLTALRPGKATIAVTVNGVTRRADVTTAWPQWGLKVA